MSNIYILFMRPTKQTRRKIKRPRKTRKQLLGGDQYFHFWRTDENTYDFDAKLKSVQCKGKTVKNYNCKRKTVIGTPYCKDHLKKYLKLSIRRSTIPGESGKGLFADEKGKQPGEMVFPAGTTITKYDGEKMTKRQIDYRYGPDDDVTAPYAVERYAYKMVRGRKTPSGSEYLDGATERGVANLANMAMNPEDNNAKLDQDTADLVATKDINQGDEIFADYGTNYLFDGPGKHSTNQYKYRRE